MRASDSYLFNDKHPLIDKLRTMIQDEGVSYQMIRDKTGVSIMTLHRWFDGTTKLPRATTLNQVGMYFGLSLDWQVTFKSKSWLDWKKDSNTTWRDWYKGENK